MTKNSHCKCVAIMMEKDGQEDPPRDISYTSHSAGYMASVETPDPSQNADTLWPIIAAFPKDNPDRILTERASFISLIMTNRAFLEAFQAPFHYSDSLGRATYVISKIEQTMYLAVAISGKKSRSDRAIQEFMYLMTRSLRNWIILSKMTPV